MLTRLKYAAFPLVTSFENVYKGSFIRCVFSHNFNFVCFQKNPLKFSQYTSDHGQLAIDSEVEVALYTY